MNKELEHFAIFDRLILDELNIKSIVRPMFQTEKGVLELWFDYNEYSWMLDGEDVTTQALLDKTPEMLEKLFNTHNVK